MRRTQMSYRYDPLDRLIGSAHEQSPATQRFYNQQRLATEKQGIQSRSVFQHLNQLLAEHPLNAQASQTLLLATDQQRSVLQRASRAGIQSSAYDTYGHITPEGCEHLLGFNGEQPDPLTGHYLLGNGHRAYNPILMRFNSPDTLSPFGKGGINAYAYCAGDPVNRSDPSGRFSLVLASAFIGFAGALLSTQRSMGFMSAAKKIWNLEPSFRAVTKVATTLGSIGASGVTVTRLTMAEYAPNSVPTQLLLASTVISGIAVAGSAVGIALHRLKKGPFTWSKKAASDAAVPNIKLEEVVTNSLASSPTSQASTSSTGISSQPSQSTRVNIQAADIRAK